MTREEAIEYLLEFAKDNQWQYDDNPPHTYCFSCGGKFKAREVLEHKPGCKLAECIEVLETGESDVEVIQEA